MTARELIQRMPHNTRIINSSVRFNVTRRSQFEVVVKLPRAIRIPAISINDLEKTETALGRYRRHR